MKKVFDFLLTILLILSLSFTLLCCANTEIKNDRTSETAGELSEPQTKTTTAPVTAVTTSGGAPDIPGGDHSVLGGVMGKAEHLDYKEGDEVALSVSLLLPYAEIPDNEAVQQKVSQKLDAINSEIRNRVDLISRNYVNDLKNGIKHLSVPSLSVNFTLCYFTEKAMSIAINMTEINASGDTYRSSEYFNFELDSYGADITFDTLFSDRLSDHRESVIGLVRDKAAGIGNLYPEYLSIIEESAPSNWFVSGESIFFRFDPYTLAPGKFGFVTFELKFTDISPYLSDYGRDLLDLK